MKIKRLINRFRKLWYWLPIIWKDQDFDDHYFWIIMRHKLKTMRDFFNSEDAMSLNSKKVAKRINLCVLLLNRIIADDYLYNNLISHDEKWGDIQITFEPVDDDMYEIHTSRPNVKTEEDKKQEEKEALEWLKVANRQEKQDKEFLLDYIKKYIRGWWD